MQRKITDVQLKLHHSQTIKNTCKHKRQNRPKKERRKKCLHAAEYTLLCYKKINKLSVTEITEHYDAVKYGK